MITKVQINEVANANEIKFSSEYARESRNLFTHCLSRSAVKLAPEEH
jgi:hypothetical protein